MLLKIPVVVCLLLFFTTGNAQQPGFNIQQYLDQIPAVPASVNEAYRQFYPKGTRSVYKQYEATLQAQLEALADESKHRSGMLLILSGRYDREGRRIDFSKIVNAEDPGLTKKQTELCRVFLNEVDYFGRIANDPIDSIRQKGEAYAVQAEKMLRIYQQAVPVFIKRVSRLNNEMNELMNRKGYNKVLDNKVQTHKYYIQLLEVRAMMLDRIKQVNQIIDGACMYVAQMKAS